MIVNEIEAPLMIARLWWKEFRQFWPISLVVALGAAGAQAMMLYYWGADARTGWLVPAAVAWAALYAVAIGAAAFAGERELKTLVLLDTLPVGRGTLWSGKVSFAFVTTAALIVVLIGIGASSTHHYEPQYSPRWTMTLCLALILQSLCWGLFWSSLVRSALAAATLTLMSVSVLGIILADTLILGVHERTTIAMGSVPVLLGISWLIMVRPKRSDFRIPAVRIALRAPIVIDSGRSRVVSDQVSPWESSTTALWRLTWATVRDGLHTFWLLFALGLGSAALGWLGGRNAMESLPVIGNFVIGLTAGISLFGSETRRGTNRFLGSHGVRPAGVWMVKLMVWSVGLAVLWTPYVVVGGLYLYFGARTVDALSPILCGALALNGFAVGQLSGMVFKRGITAWFIAVISALGVMLPQVLLIVRGLMSVEWLLAIPVALLAVSWAWSGDWIIERPGIGRWVRLGALLVGAFLVASGSYATSRVLSIPDFGDSLKQQYLRLDLPAGAGSGVVAKTYNAAALAIDSFERVDEQLNSVVVGAKTQDRAKALELMKRAQNMSPSQFQSSDKLTLFSPVNLHAIQSLNSYFSDDAHQRLKKGDLAGSWEDIEAVLRMARQVERDASLMQSMMTQRFEGNMLREAMAWSADPKQTPDRIKAALETYLDLPQGAPKDESIRMEAKLFEQTLNYPIENLRSHLAAMDGRPTPNEVFWRKLWIDSITTPWEMVRARRVGRLLFASEVVQARYEPWQWSSHPVPLVGFTTLQIADNGNTRFVYPWTLETAFQTTPLVKMLMPALEAHLVAATNLEVNRRALPQILAIRHWQLTHGGRASRYLDEMLAPFNIAGRVPSQARDPYNGQAFRWIPSRGQALLPLGEAGAGEAREFSPEHLVPTKNQWLLYSVGPDREDHHATARSLRPEGTRGDIVFPLPPEPEESKGADPKP